MTVTAKSRTVTTRTAFDTRRYGRLLATNVPVAIHTEAECKQTIVKIENLLRKGEDKLSPEEDRLLDLLSTLVERYEDEDENFSPSPPHRMLQFLMEQNGLRQVDLVKVFSSSGRVSEAVNGKRSISKAQAKALGEFFKVSPELFI